jgi:hypothetical protein
LAGLDFSQVAREELVCQVFLPKIVLKWSAWLATRLDLQDFSHLFLDGGMMVVE